MLLLQKTEQFAGMKQGMTIGDGVVLVAYAVLMFVVCAVACVVPTMRALRVQPTEALRSE
jgi:ABC-type lipoprotein release transport system permease subunit